MSSPPIDGATAIEPVIAIDQRHNDCYAPAAHPTPSRRRDLFVLCNTANTVVIWHRQIAPHRTK